MKKNNVLIVLAIAGMLSCKSGEKDSEKIAGSPDTTNQTAEVPVEVKYQCPMKCEGDTTYAMAGNCKVCGMALEKIN